MAQSLVLVVEDDADTRQALVTAISDQINEPIAQAADGDEALRIASETPPAVVLLDISMPKRNGYEVVRALRQDPKTADAWVVAVTGTGSAPEAARAGFDQFLWKPADLDHLMLAVEVGLTRRLASQIADDSALEASVDRIQVKSAPGDVSASELQLLAERLAPLAEELDDGAEADAAKIFARIESLLAQ